MRRYSPGELPKPGDKFGRLTVLHVSRRLRKRGETSTRLTCRCSCGKTTRQKVYDIRKKLVQSCGCWQKTKLTRHGQSYLREYRIWLGMIRRCHNPKSGGWPDYGGRGIKVCPRWRALGFFVRGSKKNWTATLCKIGFKNFMDDMGRRPSKHHSLDRIENDKGYCKENCRWATDKQQANNRRSSLHIKNRIPDETDEPIY